MALINENYLKLKAGYLFPEISRRVAAFSTANPGRKILRLGIGDVTRPLCPKIVEAFQKGVEEMAASETFRGYGPEQGYGFLREAAATHDFQAFGADIRPEEIFISDGSKCDTGNIQEIFGSGNTIAIGDPVYPVYVDTNVMAGKTGPVQENGYYENILYMPCLEEQGFLPRVPKKKADIIYLCFPNNPTGATASRAELVQWVDYAKANRSVILFDAAYEAFIRDPAIPHSIFEIKGAKDVAIEFRSFSKTAGFTGTRCAYTVVPESLHAYTQSGEKVRVHDLWLRRQTTKFNGVSYPVQKAAEACYTEEGRTQIKNEISYYMENARIIKEKMSGYGYRVFGAENAPYVWFKTKNNMSSWNFFDLLLDKAGVVGTPGQGFGPSGEGYFRFSAFSSRNVVTEAMDALEKV